MLKKVTTCLNNLKSPSTLMAFFMLFSIAYGGFYGRLPDKDEYDRWIYATDKKERKMAFVHFDAVENKDFVFDKSFTNLGKTMPETIALMMAKGFFVETQEGDFIPQGKNINNKSGVINEQDYEKLEFVIDEKAELELQKNKQALGTNTTNATNATNVTNKTKITNTNFNIVSFYEHRDDEEVTLEKALAATNYAFTKTNVEENRYFVYLYKEDKRRSIDVEGFSPWQVDALQASGVRVYKDQEGNYYLPEVSDEKKKLSVESSLYQIDGVESLAELLDDKAVDYFIYGTYSQISRRNFLLSVYLIYPSKRLVGHVISKKLEVSSLREDLQEVPVAILAFIQGKKVIENVNFKSASKGGLLYLDNVFSGTLPVKINKLVEGEYNFRVWHPTKSYALLDDRKEEKENLLIDEDDLEIDFQSSERLKWGELDVQITNSVSADFYLEGVLKGADTTSYQSVLPEGNYVLKVSRTNFNTLYIELPIESSATTQLYFSFEPKKEKKLWEKRLFNHDRNARIFAALGFIAAGATMASYMETLDREDRLRSVEKKIEDNYYGTQSRDALDQYVNQIRKDYDTALAISASLFFGVTVPMFLIATISYSLNIFLDRAEIVPVAEGQSQFGIKIQKKINSSINSPTNSR